MAEFKEYMSGLRRAVIGTPVQRDESVCFTIDEDGFWLVCSSTHIVKRSEWAQCLGEIEHTLGILPSDWVKSRDQRTLHLPAPRSYDIAYTTFRAAVATAFERHKVPGVVIDFDG